MMPENRAVPWGHQRPSAGCFQAFNVIANDRMDLNSGCVLYYKITAINSYSMESRTGQRRQCDRFTRNRLSKAS